ncbi:hypothetical protein CEE45_00845 [Candidatus Heimdallarchaeota archaeon B3_Heim]|nr:MAG: hypothetical protein CEE45_00845 [Candidatus Heimdallarchaeota archaeon B3_Heim]
MKVDLSNIPDAEIIDELANMIEDKEKIKTKKEGKTLIVKDLSSRKLKFYTKKVLGRKDLPGVYKVVSQGDHFLVYFQEL